MSQQSTEKTIGDFSETTVQPGKTTDAPSASERCLLETFGDAHAEILWQQWVPGLGWTTQKRISVTVDQARSLRSALGIFVATAQPKVATAEVVSLEALRSR